MGCCGSDSTDEIPNFRQKQPSNPQTVQVEGKNKTQSNQDQNQYVVKKVVKSSQTMKYLLKVR